MLMHSHPSPRAARPLLLGLALLIAAAPAGCGDPDSTPSITPEAGSGDGKAPLSAGDVAKKRFDDSGPTVPKGRRR